MKPLSGLQLSICLESLLHHCLHIENKANNRFLFLWLLWSLRHCNVVTIFSSVASWWYVFVKTQFCIRRDVPYCRSWNGDNQTVSNGVPLFSVPLEAWRGGWPREKKAHESFSHEKYRSQWCGKSHSTGTAQIYLHLLPLKISLFKKMERKATFQPPDIDVHWYRCIFTWAQENVLLPESYCAF